MKTIRIQITGTDGEPHGHGGWEMDLYFDHSVTEIYADQGTRTFTQLVYPNAPYTCFRLEGGAETAVLRV